MRRGRPEWGLQAGAPPALPALNSAGRASHPRALPAATTFHGNQRYRSCIMQKKSCFCLLRSCCFADLCVQSTAATFPPWGRCSLEPPQPHAAPGSRTQSSVSAPLWLSQAPQESRCLPCPHHLPSEVQPPDPDLQGSPKLNPCNGFTPETQRTPRCRGRLEDHGFVAGLGGPFDGHPGEVASIRAGQAPGSPAGTHPGAAAGAQPRQFGHAGAWATLQLPHSPLALPSKKLAYFILELYKCILFPQQRKASIWHTNPQIGCIASLNYP